MQFRSLTAEQHSTTYVPTEFSELAFQRKYLAALFNCTWLNTFIDF